MADKPKVEGKISTTSISFDLFQEDVCPEQMIRIEKSKGIESLRLEEFLVEAPFSVTVDSDTAEKIGDYILVAIDVDTSNVGNFKEEILLSVDSGETFSVKVSALIRKRESKPRVRKSFLRIPDILEGTFSNHGVITLENEPEATGDLIWTITSQEVDVQKQVFDVVDPNGTIAPGVEVFL